jgi:predicted NBD/HSP70 family sugar kinase
MRGALTAEAVFSSARRGNAAAKAALELEASRVALAIAAIAPVVDPELVILGGGVGRHAEQLLDPIERELRRLLPFRPRVAISTLGDDAVLLGAITVALEAARERLFARPTRPLDEAAG